MAQQKAKSKSEVTQCLSIKAGADHPETPDWGDKSEKTPSGSD